MAAQVKIGRNHAAQALEFGDLQRGKPRGHRPAISAAPHSSSVPHELRNSRIDSPGWNCTRFIGMAHLLGGCAHPGASLAHRMSLLNFIANQELP
jgi:hypothetical protein